MLRRHRCCLDLRSGSYQETITADGGVRPGSGRLVRYEPPNGPGVRTDGFGYVGYKTSVAYDSLLAKVIVHDRSSNFSDVARKAIRALSEFHLEGARNNISFLKNILSHEDFISGATHTRWIEETVEQLTNEWQGPDYFMVAEAGGGAEAVSQGSSKQEDPLAVFSQQDATGQGAPAEPQEIDCLRLVSGRAPIPGTIVAVEGRPAQVSGDAILIIESMKMEHEMLRNAMRCSPDVCR